MINCNLISIIFIRTMTLVKEFLRFLVSVALIALFLSQSLPALADSALASDTFIGMKVAALLASPAGPIVGTVTPGTPVKVLKSVGAMSEVEISGWSTTNAPTNVFSAEGQRMLLVHIADPAQLTPAVSKVVKDEYGTFWQDVTVKAWIQQDATVSDVAKVWDAAQGLYNTRCSACHALHTPDQFTANQWPGVLRVMAKNASLTKDEDALILKFLQTNAKSQ
ncbi:hypothetical protein [Thiomonas sp.]